MTVRKKVENTARKTDRKTGRKIPDNARLLKIGKNLAGAAEHLAEALERALLLGYRDFKWLAKDPDLRPLRKHPIYRSIQDKIRKIKIRIG